MKRLYLLLLSVSLCLVMYGQLFSPLALAQQSLTLSVTPPLFQLNVAPLDVWKSSVKVINSNPTELVVYAQVFDFEPRGEDGQGDFIPPPQTETKATLAQWIEVTNEAIVIPPEQSIDVPVTVMVPEGASPGGHFAAILIGTRPPSIGVGSVVRTSQVVTSLFFMRVAGDVKESGLIREFSVSHLFREEPEADFILRFQNDGNVQLQPQGTITIYNMWGKERGVIPINQKSHFGNVLPDSIRRFEFAWHGESSLSDIGRYMAEVTLTYGAEGGRQNVSNRLYFWVIPLKATLAVLAALASFAFFVVWAVRRYIRRALYLSGYEVQRPTKPLPKVGNAKTVPALPTRPLPRKNFALPLREGVLDLRTRIRGSHSRTALIAALLLYARTYRFFFVGSMIALFFSIVCAYYLSDVLRDQKSYEVTLDRGDMNVVLSSEEVIKQSMQPHAPSEIVDEASSTQPFRLSLQNATAIPGTASRVALLLEGLGYEVADISHDPEVRRERSVIVYDKGLEDIALVLSRQLGNMLVSQNEVTEAETTPASPDIRIIVGSDREE